MKTVFNPQINFTQMSPFACFKSLSILAISLVVCALSANAQFDTQFWFPPIWNDEVSNNNDPSELFITTPYDFDVLVKIRTLNGTLSLDTTVTSGNPLIVPLTPQIGMTNQPNEILLGGIKVGSSAPVQVVHRVAANNNSSLVTLKGYNGLGREFFACSQVRNLDETYGDNEHHFISVMARFDDTSITIESPFNMWSEDGPLPNPLTITLDRDECYLVRGDGPMEHVAGSKITSSKDIIVNSGSTHTRMANGNAAEAGTDQIVPVELMGTEFIVIKGLNGPTFDYAIMIATEDNTQIFVNGGTSPIAIIDEGEFFDYTLTGNFGDPAYIRTNKTAYCYHVSGASGFDEVGMSAIPQLDCTGSQYIEFSKFQQNASVQVINAIVPEFAEPTFSLNGVYYQDVPGVVFNSVPGASDWTVVSFPNSQIADNNVLTTDDGFFHAGFLTGDGNQTGTYGFLSGFDDAFDFIDPNSGLPTTIYQVATLCQGDQIDHCFLIESCGDDHNITNFEGNLGQVIVTPPSSPFDSCFQYIAPFGFTGNDTITFTVENRFGFEGQVDVFFTILDPDTPIDAGPNQNICSDTFTTLNAIDPDPLVEGYWTVLQGDGVLADPTDPNTQVVNLSFGENLFLWHQDYPCQQNIDVVQVNVFDGTAPPAQAGPDVELCSDVNNYVMQANDPLFTAVGTWEITFGNATINDINDPNALVSNIGIGCTFFEWNIDNGPCPGAATVDEMVICVYDNNHLPANAGADQELCDDTFTSATLTGNSITEPAVGTWELVSGSGTITSPDESTTTVTGLAIGENVFRYSIDNGPCGVTEDLVSLILYDDQPSAVNAGPDAEYCGPIDNHQLDATDPIAPAFGQWTLIQGSGSFADPNNPNTFVSNLGFGENIFRWTLSNGPCANTGDFDEVSIFIFSSGQAVADAGDDDAFCSSGDVSFNLDGNDADFPAVGTWSVQSGSGIFADPNDPNTSVSGANDGTNVYVWTIDNGPCGTTSDAVSIVIFDDDPIPANAGVDTEYCLPTTTHVLQATAPAPPSFGVWSIVQGAGSISNLNDPTATVTNLAVGENIFRWSIENGPCPSGSNFDEVSITIFDSSQESSDPGPDQELCQSFLSPVNTTMAANTALSPAVGTWTVISGTGNFADSNDPNTAVSGLSFGDNVFMWTIDNGACGTTNATVTITVFDEDQPDANAGADQSICSDQLSITLTGTAFSYPTTGIWQLVSGTAIITSPTAATTAVTGLSVGINVFQYTIDNGPCPAGTTTDQVSVLVYDSNAGDAFAGVDFDACSSDPIITLDADPIAIPGEGTWTVVSGTATITDPNDPNSTITGFDTGILVLEWTTNNGPCPNPNNTDQVVISIYDEDGAVADAGDDILLCSPINSTQLSANTPITPATGSWTIISGIATLSNANDPTATLSNISQGEVVLSWTVDNGPCAISSAQDFVSVFLDGGEDVGGSAGPDQSFCEPISSTQLSGAPVSFPTVGLWTLVSGSGTINSPNNPNTTVSNLQVGENIFRWTTSSDACGTSEFDEVSIFIYPSDQDNADAGDDIELCTEGLNPEQVTLDANSAEFPATGQWQLISGSATIVDPSNPNTTVLGLTQGTVVLEWTIDNGPCANGTTSDQMQIDIFFDGIPPANAGTDLELCTPNNFATMTANMPSAPATGEWTLVSGFATIDDPTDPSTLISNIGLGTTVLEWTIFNGPCTPPETSDQLTIILNDAGEAPANAGPDQFLCFPQTSTTLQGNEPQSTSEGVWTVVSGAGNITDPSNPNTTITGLEVGITVLQWTIENGNCVPPFTTDQMQIFVFPEGLPQANAGEDQEICFPEESSVIMTAEAAIFPGQGTWTQVAGPVSTIVDVNDEATDVTGLQIGTSTFVWELDYATCGLEIDTVDIRVYDSNHPAADAGPDQEFCTPTTSTFLAANAANDPAVGTWIVLQGGGSFEDPNDPNTEVSNMPVGTNIFSWNIYNGGCGNPEDYTDAVEIKIYNENQADADAGEDISICFPSSTAQLDANSYSDPAEGFWTQISGLPLVITDADDPQSTVIGLQPGVYELEWTIDNGPCPNGITTDVVTIQVFASDLVADAGPDQAFCTPTSSATMAANSQPAPAVGVWTILQGSGVFADINDPNTTVTGIGVGTNVFQWSFANGDCDNGDSDTVTILIFPDGAGGAEVGEDIELCEDDPNTVLNAEDIPNPQTGIWEVIQGSGDILNPTDPNSPINNVGVGTNLLTWTVDNGPCSNGTTTDTLAIFVFPSDPNIDSPDDIFICSDQLSVVLPQTDPQDPIVGTWTVIQGTGTFSDPNDPNATVTDLSVGENILVWTLDNGPCSISTLSDEISIFVFDVLLNSTNAGPDQSICLPQSTVIMDAETPTFPAQGSWSVVSGSAVFADENSASTSVSGLSIGANVLEWTVDNGACGTAFQDQMVVFVFDNTASGANIGDDVELCFPDNSTTLNALPLIGAQTGSWSILSGAGTLSNPGGATTTITDLEIGVTTVEYTLFNGPCDGGITTDVIDIRVYDPNSPIADAGPNQSYCTPVSTAVMDGSEPTFPAVGTWSSAILGTGTPIDANDPNTTMIGLTVGENVFTYTIYNGPCNDPTVDFISIFIYNEFTPAAFAGEDLEICLPLDEVNMGASPAEFPAAGIWTSTGNCGVITDLNNPNALITDLQEGTCEFIWTVDNGPCPNGLTTDTMQVRVFSPDAPAANAGTDQEWCTPISTTQLEGNQFTDPQIGTWSIACGNGVISDVNDPQAIVSGLTVGTHCFVWTIDNGPCGSTTDEVIIEIFDENQGDAAATDVELCLPETSTNLTGNPVISPAVGTWELIDGTGDIANANDPLSAVTNLSVGTNVFTWTIDNGPCPNGITVDTMEVRVFTDDVLASDAGPDLFLCTPISDVVMQANTPSDPSFGTWNAPGLSVSDLNDPNAVVSAIPVGTHVLTWEIYNGPCAEGNTIDSVTITVYDDNQPDAEAGDDIELCSPESSTVLAANAALPPAIGTWQFIEGNATLSDINNNTAELSDLEIGSYQLTWTINNGACGSSIDTLDVRVYDPLSPDAMVGPDQEFCSPFTGTTLTGNTPIPPAVGTWEVISGNATLSDINDPTADVTGLDFGVSILTWQIYNGSCENGTTTDTIAFYLNDSSVADAFAGDDIRHCGPIDSLILDGSETIGNTAFGYWEIITGGGTILDSLNEHSYAYNIPLGINTYQWTVDNGFCGISSDTVDILNYDPDQEASDAGEDITICEHEFEEFVLEPPVEPIAPAVGSWEVISGPAILEIMEGDSAINPTVTSAGELIVALQDEVSTLVYTIANGPCGTTQDTLILTLEDCLTILIPDAFSPNGDGVNDVFEILNLDSYPNNELMIFNRWGAELYKAAPYNNDWNGTSQHDASLAGELPASTYYYIFDPGDGREPLSGFVYLRR